MFNEQFDQAAGLRRLFHAAPPQVVGIVPCSASVMPWVAQQILARASDTERLLALDEWGAYGNLADSLLVSSRFDLLQAAEGHVNLQDCLVDVRKGLQLAAVSRLASALGGDRMVNQRVLSLLKDLQRHFSEWLVVARAADAMGVSSLLSAVPSVVMAVDARPESVTAAYATLKQLAERDDLPAATVVFTQPQSREAQALASNLQRVVHDQLGLPLVFARDLKQALSVGEAASPQKFLDRLLLAASRPNRRVAGWRPKYACI